MFSFEIRKSNKSKYKPYYFVIYAISGKLVATSKMYMTKQEVKNEIQLIQKQALTAKVIDTTTSFKSRLRLEAAYGMPDD